MASCVICRNSTHHHRHHHYHHHHYCHHHHRHHHHRRRRQCYFYKKYSSFNKWSSRLDLLLFVNSSEASVHFDRLLSLFQRRATIFSIVMNSHSTNTSAVCVCGWVGVCYTTDWDRCLCLRLCLYRAQTVVMFKRLFKVNVLWGAVCPCCSLPVLVIVSLCACCSQSVLVLARLCLF